MPLTDAGQGGGFKQLTKGLAVVPTGLTDVSTKDSWIRQITVSNIHTSSVTFLVQDKSGSTLALIPTVSLPPNSTTVITFPAPVKMTSGISWQAGTASKLNAEIDGYRIP